MRSACSGRPALPYLELQGQIMRLRMLDSCTNLVCLVREYLCLTLIIGGTVAWAEARTRWGSSPLWNIPVFLLAIVLIGAVQHRLAGLGHEASHYTFMKHRFLNDFLPDLFCMFPLITTVHFYRVFHMAHHQFTNDPRHDPDLLNLGHGKRAFEFPMTRRQFIALIYFCVITAPVRFIRFQLAYITVNSLGKGRSAYLGTETTERFAELYLPRLGTVLGVAYILALGCTVHVLRTTGATSWIVPAGLAGMVIASLAAFALPDWAVYRSPFRHAYSSRFASVARLFYYSLVVMALAGVQWLTGLDSTFYLMVLWFVPIFTTFPFFMLLRDVYQHSNADSGQLTNSRVFFTDPFTRWAVFVYGQDMHIPHHLFPAIPHYRLGVLHELLKRSSAAYGSQVVECHGTFGDRLGRVTILDEMTRRPSAARQAGGPDPECAGSRAMAASGTGSTGQ